MIAPMKARSFVRCRFVTLVTIVITASALSPRVRGADLTGSYVWNPVSIGAGGWVTGFVVHPLDPAVRYCRTDVGNAYRWDAAANRWAPMLVVRDDGGGIPARLVTAPGSTGVDSIAIDPANRRIVLVAFPITHSPDAEKISPSVESSVYRSQDGGLSFTKSDLAVHGEPNGPWRAFGERLKIDPSNSNIVYFGTAKSGLYRSSDGGRTWLLVSQGNAPSSGDLMNVQISAAAGTVNVRGRKVSRRIFIAAGDGDVSMSDDGGQSWTNITKNISLSGHAGQSTLDQAGTLYVTQSGTNRYWRYRDGKWTPPVTVPASDGVQNVAVDPTNARRLFALGRGGGLSRSPDDGQTWTAIAQQFDFANTLGWLPQPIGGWRSNSGLTIDHTGTLWVAQGNEGVLRYKPARNDSESEAKPIRWTIDSAGIEELCTQDVVIPKGGGDKAYVAVQDATGMVITDPAHFTARWIAMDKRNLITHATGLAACPNDPNFVAIAATGGNAGYTDDGGKTWRRFSNHLPDELVHGPTAVAGAIAVSRRAEWSTGADHLVILPSNNRPPFFSKDGGKTWTKTRSFPMNPDGALAGGQDGFWGYFLKQRPLRADPFVPDRFYLKLTMGDFYVSKDGGATWTKTSDALPAGTHHGQVEVSYAVRDDLWLCDGFAGAYAGKLQNPHGLFHSPNAGKTWNRIAGIDNAITLALGRGSGNPGDSPQTIYFYGKLASEDAWGIFRSTDAAKSWSRISRYPAGIFDQPTCLAASWETFGQVYVGFSGQSFAYGKPK
jgi:hypothetical protein